MQENNKTQIKKWYSAIIVLLPILNIYSAGISSLGIGDVFCVIIIVFLLLKNKGKVRISERNYGRFALYFLLISFILAIVINEYSMRQFILKGLRFLVYTILIICYGKDSFDAEFGFDFYINVSVIAAVYLILQYIFKTFFSVTLPMTIPYLKLLYTDSTGAIYNEELLNMYSIFGYRAPGFFKEPSHFCQYVSLSVALLLFRPSLKARRNILITIIVAAIIVSYSAIGYISLIVTIVFWFIFSFRDRRLTNNILIMVIGTVSLVWLSVASGAYSSAVSRIQTINYTYAATGNLRLLRGFYVYKEMPTLFKIIGIGCGNYSAFIDKFGIQTFFDGRVDKHVEYMSAISCVLVNSGIIGIGLFFAGLIEIFRKTNLIQKILFVNFIILLVATSSFFSAIYVLYMVFLVADMSSSRDARNTITLEGLSYSAKINHD